MTHTTKLLLVSLALVVTLGCCCDTTTCAPANSSKVADAATSTPAER